MDCFQSLILCTSDQNNYLDDEVFIDIQQEDLIEIPKKKKKFFNVEKILDKKKFGNFHKYKVNNEK